MEYLIKEKGIKKAEEVRTFIESLEHVKGIWDGKPFKLIREWQWEKVIRPLFGTLNDEGYRQYRICYVEIPKKNGKSPLGAAIALYMLCADREASPEIYFVATDKEQASYAYYYASEMAKRNPYLKHLKILDGRKRIINPRNNGILQVLASADAHLHGLNPSCVIFDEFHAQRTDALWRTLTAGTHYARQQQLIFVITTAGIFDKESVWWRVREKARQIEQGIIKEDSFLPVLYIADPNKDKPEDREVWKRVNPSLGHIFDMKTVEKDFETAKNDPVAFQDFKRFRLNIPIRQKNKWLPMDKWDACAGKIDEEKLLKRTCYGGLDASTRIDLTAFVLIFPPEDDEKYIVLPFFFIPEETIIRRSQEDRVHYEIWVDKGLIFATPGNSIDHRFVKEKIVELSKMYNLMEIGFDPKAISQLAAELQDDHNLKMVEIVQTYGQFNEPAQDMYSKILDGKVNHGGHEVLRWCADNLVMKIGLREEVLPDKSAAIERIDGIVALMMAWKQMMFGEKESVYEDRDLRIL